MTHTVTRRKALALAAPSLALIATGCQAAPAPAAKAAAAPVANKLILMVDIVHGAKNLTEDQRPTRGCVLNNRFPRNSEVVWRARVHDPSTGEGMSDKEAKTEIRLANGTNIEMNYRPARNDPTELYWTGAWVVPKDHPTGTLNFSVVATDDNGRSGEFKPINVPSSLLVITDEVLPDIAPKA
jgi:hypothetical protein